MNDLLSDYSREQNSKSQVPIKSLYDQIKYLSRNYSNDSSPEKINQTCMHNAAVASKIKRKDIEEIWEFLGKIYPYGDQEQTISQQIQKRNNEFHERQQTKKSSKIDNQRKKANDQKCEKTFQWMQNKYAYLY